MSLLKLKSYKKLEKSHYYRYNHRQQLGHYTVKTKSNKVIKKKLIAERLNTQQTFIFYILYLYQNDFKYLHYNSDFSYDDKNSFI